MLNVRWGDKLESLARALFDGAAKGTDPFVPECVVVGSPVMKGWLKQHFLFERRAEQRVLANWEFVPLFQFVNDWLARMEGETDEPREPALHPYSKECLRWRIYRLLESEETAGLETLRRYVGDDAKSKARRRFGLAGQIARMFDDYQNYRAEMLVAWEHDQDDGLGDDVEKHAAWQRILWNALKAQDVDSYLSLFLKMDDQFPGEALKKAYRRISVFHVSSMPIPYVHFFELLSEFMDVTIYAFNPSEAEWFGDVTPMQGARRALLGASALVGEVDATLMLETGNPLLSSWGKGCQSYLDELLDRTDGQPAGSGETEACGTTLLEKVQAQVRGRDELPSCRIAHFAEDPSIQFHICHSPMREVEVLRDQLLAWFKEYPERQPRHVQVLVTDLDKYAPFIDAVFQTELPDARDTIPYEITDRPTPGAGPLGTAYLALLRCCESRFTAPELMGLLALDGIREAFELSAEDVDAARDFVIKSGIRWGADADHLKTELGTEMDVVATWRRGLDRLLLGYAMGRDRGSHEPRMVDAGDLGTLRTVDDVEAGGARLVGTLCRFFDDVHDVSETFKRACIPAQWDERLQQLLDTFFRSSSTTFAEIAEIRAAIRIVSKTAAVAGDELLPHDVIASAIEAQLQAAGSAVGATSNSVLFTPMRTMRPTPRPLLYLLGMDEGVFPRRDDRATFDLMACIRRRGDRSLRLDDRLTFLEALMCARERLVISSVGLNQKSNEPMPPSTVVSELRQYLDDVFCSEERDGVSTTPYRVVEHRLQAFHANYFTEGSGFVSFSRPNFDAAEAIRKRVSGASIDSSSANIPVEVPADDLASASSVAERLTVRLSDLQMFFLNPAKVFYTRTLQARIDNLEDGVLSDKEAFSLGGLENYQMNDALLNQLLVGHVAENAAAMLREQGLLPLGVAGDVLTEDRQVELTKFLDFNCSNLAVTVRQLMCANPNEALTMALVFEGEAVTATGSVPMVSLGEQPYQVCARYTSIKAKDRLRAWIAHVLGHAAGDSPFMTILVGKGNDEVAASSEELIACSTELASTTLEALLGLWQQGAACALPFAPASSYAFAEAYRRAEKAGNPEKMPAEEGMKEAQKAWHNGFNPVLGEDQDPYLKHVWGDAGPMADPRFAELALTVWSPYLDTCDRAQENTTNNDNTGGEE